MSEPFLAEIKIVSFGFSPRGWALCNGQLLPINQNQALFSLLGTTYGGDGRVNFGLPDLRGRTPIHMGNGHTQGEVAGSPAVTITAQTMPQHMHFMQGVAETPPTVPGNATGNSRTFAQGLIGLQGGGTAAVNLYESPATALTTLAPEVVANAGGSQAHENRMPSLVLNFAIALQGIFPSQN
ncbi:MAG: phage tail protein [Ramlibacter sp.]|nr:phage tail protein [Ramlibacter sp.]